MPCPFIFTSRIYSLLVLQYDLLLQQQCYPCQEVCAVFGSRRQLWEITKSMRNTWVNIHLDRYSPPPVVLAVRPRTRTATAYPACFNFSAYARPSSLSGSIPAICI
jgi:hypothetical protein